MSRVTVCGILCIRGFYVALRELLDTVGNEERFDVLLADEN